MNLALRLALALAVLLVIVNGIIQRVFDLIEARKHRHDGIDIIEMDRSTGGLERYKCGSSRDDLDVRFEA